MPPYPGFAGGSYVSQSPIAYNARTVNFYCERLELPYGKSQDVLYPSPGVVLLDTVTTPAGRAHFAQDGREFAVIGTQFGSISAAGTFTAIGTVATDANPATISSNGDGGGQILITSGGLLYIYDLNALTFTPIVVSFTATMGAHLDGFFLALDATTSTVYLSDLLDGTTWDPTQFFQRSIQPDPWIAMKVWDRYLWLFGTETSEVWYDAGTSPIPFQPHPSGLVPYGTAAAFSPEVVGSSIMWLARTVNGSGLVVRASGFTPDVVSTFPLSVAFAGYDDIDDAVGDTYEDLGHSFYVLTFPTSGTWVYDATTTLNLPQAMRWTERGTWISEDTQYVPWRPLYHAFAFGEHRMLDRETGAIYRLSSDELVDVDDRPLRRLRRPPALQADEARLFVNEFTVGLEPGLGTQSGQGADPQMALRISVDGGKTFGTERTRSAGAAGQYTTRVEWTRCGSAKKGTAWQPEIICSDPIPWRITGASFTTRRAA